MYWKISETLRVPSQMGTKQQFILPCYLCKLSEERKGQEILAEKVVETYSRHLKENISIAGRNLIDPSFQEKAVKKVSKKDQKCEKQRIMCKERDTDNGIRK